MIQALMVEDDPDITTLLVNYLRLHDIALTAVATPAEGLERLGNEAFAFVILDLTLPQMDGLALCKMIRSRSDIPILISSARSDIDDKVIALEYGADDYLPKPYEPDELIARIKSVLRRYRPSASAPSAPKFTLKEEEQQIYLNAKALPLTRAEYEVLALLIHNAGQILSREYIITHTRSISWDSSARTVDVIIRRIRQKVETDPKNPLYVHSVRGSGYSFSG